MIKSIHLRNFQGHRETDVELDPGVNVIAGQSDAGKTSIIRALYWIFRNRPAGAGEAFRHHAADKKAEVSAKVVLDHGQVMRFRQGSDNGYQVDGTTLVAIRADVPQEVADRLDLGEHNVQTQHSPYFLLADSPGDVARKLNEVCGLDIIDECLKNAGLLVSRNGAAATECQRRVAELEASRERYADVPAREAAVAALEAKTTRQVAAESKLIRLRATLASLTAERTHLTALNEFLTAQPRAAELAAKTTQREEVLKRLAGLRTALANLEDACGQLAEATRRQEQAEQELADRLRLAGVCPLCHQPIH